MNTNTLYIVRKHKYIYIYKFACTHIYVHSKTQGTDAPYYLVVVGVEWKMMINALKAVITIVMGLNLILNEVIGIAGGGASVE